MPKRNVALYIDDILESISAETRTIIVSENHLAGPPPPRGGGPNSE